MLIRLEIGAWSHEGHGKHEEFFFMTNVGIQTLREAHRNMREKIGFSIEEICTEYEEQAITSYYIIDRLQELLSEEEFDNLFLFDEKGYYGDEGLYIVRSPESMAILWARLLEITDQNIAMIFQPKKRIPSLNQSGKSNFMIGYGLFS